MVPMEQWVCWLNTKSSLVCCNPNISPVQWLFSAILSSFGYSICVLKILSLSCNWIIEWYSLHIIMVIWRCRKPFTQVPFEGNAIITKGYCVGRVQTQLYDPVIYLGFLSSTMCLLSKWPLLLSGQCCDHNYNSHHRDFAKVFLMLWHRNAFRTCFCQRTQQVTQ